MIIRKISIARIGLFSWVLLLSACASIQSNISNGASFASAGIVYIDAIPAILDESFMLTVKANSQQLLMSRDVLTEDERMAQLEASDELLETRLELLHDLNTHALWLRSYFLSLKALTASENASGINNVAQDLVTQMGALRPAIAAMSIGGVQISGLMDPAINLAVGTHQNAALNNELKVRGNAIERELALQKAVMSILVDQMKDDAQLLNEIENKNPVFDEYVAAKKVSDKWRKKRVAAFKQTVELQSLESINKAADNLHGSWIAFVEKRDVAGTMELLIQDIEQVLSITRQFKEND